MGETIEEHTIQSWKEFTEMADKLDVGKPENYPGAFRGHSVARWPLEPTLLRKLREVMATEEEALKIEKLALSEFRSQAHLYLDSNTFSTHIDTISWWTLMQHHGAPTRLLDWCKSIYVAAYFAVSDHPESPGAVWIVNKSMVPQLTEKKHGAMPFPKEEKQIKKQFEKPEAPHIVFFFDRVRKTNRMVAQQGLFSVCRNVLGSHEEVLVGLHPEQSRSHFIQKYVIPEKQKALFLRRLRGMNISASSLFPGIDGFGKSISEFVDTVDIVRR